MIAVRGVKAAAWRNKHVLLLKQLLRECSVIERAAKSVIELYEGRVIRDEIAGGYTEESTTEFGVRMRAEMGVGVEGHSNGVNN